MKMLKNKKVSNFGEHCHVQLRSQVAGLRQRQRVRGLPRRDGRRAEADGRPQVRARRQRQAELPRAAASHANQYLGKDL